MPGCLVFGGSGALGRVVCEALAAQGARLAFTYHTGEAVAAALRARHPQALALRLDLVDTAAIDRVIDEATAALGGLDSFVHCAAVGDVADLADISAAAWDQMHAVNVRSAFWAVRRLSGVLRRGNIVLCGSMDGIKMVPSPVHHAAANGALSGMVQALAKELGPRDVRVNLVTAGILEGGVSRAVPEALRREYLKHCSLKRVGRFAEVAAMICFLALDNSYITGQTLLLDGGL